MMMMMMIPNRKMYPTVQYSLGVVLLFLCVAADFLDTGLASGGRDGTRSHPPKRNRGVLLTTKPLHQLSHQLIVPFQKQ